MTTTIKITFNRDLVDSEGIVLSRIYDNGTGNPSPSNIISEVFKNTAIVNGQILIGLPTQTIGERSAIDYANAIDRDYILSSPGEIYSLTVSGNVVTLVVNRFWQYTLVSTVADVVVNITNGSTLGLFSITDFTFSQAAVNNPCKYVKATVTTNSPLTQAGFAYIGSSSVDVTANISGNTCSFEVLRGIVFRTKCGNGVDLVSLTITGSNIVELLDNNIDIIQVNTPVGTTVTFNHINSRNLILEYSINNIDWFINNVFTNVLNGNHTVYIRDSFGCSTQKDFIVDGVINDNGIVYVSESNSIRYALNENITPCGIRPNRINTLSFNENYEIAKAEVQRFLSCDNIITQAQTNYSNIDISIIDNETGNIIGNSIPSIQSDFIDLKDKRDAIKYRYADNKIAVYFISGHIYDYDTNVYTGNDYTLNGYLPEFAVLGNYVEIDSNWYEIKEVTFDENKEVEIIVLEGIYNGIEVSTIISSIYNLYDYNVFEFNVDMSLYNNKCIKINILFTDNRFNDISYTSENILIRDYFENCIKIEYYNDRDNDDMYYTGGFKNLIRLLLDKDSIKNINSHEINKTDNNVDLISSDIHQGVKLQFDPLTTGLIVKLEIALNCENLIIENINRTIDSYENKGRLEKSNLYVISANLLYAGNNKNNNGSNRLSNFDVNIPNLVKTGNGFLIYKQ